MAEVDETPAIFTSTRSVQSDQKRGRSIAQMTARGAFITHPVTLSDSPGERIADGLTSVEFRALAANYPGQLLTYQD